MRRRKNKIFRQAGLVLGLISSISIQADSSLDVSIDRHQATFENAACLLYTSPSPRDATLSRMPSSA